MMEEAPSSCIPQGLRAIVVTNDGWKATLDFSPDGKYGVIGMPRLFFHKFKAIESEAEAKAEAKRLYREKYSMSGSHWVYYPKGLEIFRSRKGQTPWGETDILYDEEFVSAQARVEKTLTIPEVKSMYPETYEELKALETKYKGIYFVED